jgi:hypothetical protein
MNVIKLKEVFVIITVALVAIVSIGFLFVAEPEDRSITSEDWFVTIEGQWLSDTDITIDRTGELRYDILPRIPFSASPINIYFETEGLDPELLDVYQYDEFIDMWEKFDTEVFSETEVSIATSTLGSFALIQTPEVNAPTFVSQFDELLQMVADGTVGYEIAVGIVMEDGDILRLAGEGQVGGCGGVIGHGNIHERSELEHEARVLVNDVETLVHFLFVGEWIVDESGCSEGASLESVL